MFVERMGWFHREKVRLRVSCSLLKGVTLLPKMDGSLGSKPRVTPNAVGKTGHEGLGCQPIHRGSTPILQTRQLRHRVLRWMAGSALPVRAGSTPSAAAASWLVFFSVFLMSCSCQHTCSEWLIKADRPVSRKL